MFIPSIMLDGCAKYVYSNAQWACGLSLAKCCEVKPPLPIFRISPVLHRVSVALRLLQGHMTLKQQCRCWFLYGIQGLTDGSRVHLGLHTQNPRLSEM